MTAPLAASLILLSAYLVGALPFGYLIGRMRGVNLFREGSGNIGATNAARVLGRGWGLVIFALDFAKGAVPVAAALPLARQLSSDSFGAFGPEDILRVGAAAAAFLGHIFPIYLGFRGGKGVATGAGTIFVLVPGPALVALLFWVTVLLASRTVSLASMVAALVLLASRLFGPGDPLGSDGLPVTLYLAVAGAVVVLKHRSNVGRLRRGTESPLLADTEGRRTALRAVHLLALGMWLGGAGFFNFFAAPAIFESFRRVVNQGPSDRTANVEIVPPGASIETKDALASALAGSAVGPVFPLYFGMQAVCSGLALATALAWWPIGGVHRGRVILIAVAALTIAVGWPISNHVSALRPLRFDPSTATAARPAFVAWHLVSLFLSFVTVVLAGVALALAAKLPDRVETASSSKRPPDTEAGAKRESNWKDTVSSIE